MERLGKRRREEAGVIWPRQSTVRQIAVLSLSNRDVDMLLLEQIGFPGR